MNLQTTLFMVLSCLILFLAMLVVIVVFVGILRIAIISVFDFDFVESYKNRKGKEPVKKKSDDDLPRIYKLGINGDKDV